MPKKEVLFGNEMRNRIRAGIDKTANAIKYTIGAKGRNAFIDDPMQPKITNDGVSIAKAITLPDPFENMGAWLVKNTSAQTNDDAGDGTSTTAVLLQAIIDEALKRPENATDIMHSLDKASAKVTELIKTASKQIGTDDLESIATISSENPVLGKMIADIFKTNGPDTPFKVEEGRKPETEVEIKEGLEVAHGYLHSMFITDQTRGVSEFENVHVLVSERPIKSLAEMKGLFEDMQSKGVTSLVIIATDVDNTALQQLFISKVQNGFTSLVVRVKGIDLEDMSAMCGSEIVRDNGLKASDVRVANLGKAKKITATQNKTFIINSCDKAKEHITLLRAQAETTENHYDKESLHNRADRMSGGLAIIRVGAHTDSERIYLRDKIEDAVNATCSAFEEGIVEGGGLCLYKISEQLGRSVGEQILRNALKAPFKAIVQNAGQDYAYIVKNMKKKGYNARTGEFVDMYKAGIVDPAKVTRCAFQNAVSSASRFITAETAISNIKENETRTQ